MRSWTLPVVLCAFSIACSSTKSSGDRSAAGAGADPVAGTTPAGDSSASGAGTNPQGGTSQIANSLPAGGSISMPASSLANGGSAGNPTKTSTGSAATGGAASSSAAPAAGGATTKGLGAFPYVTSPVTRGGTMTFTNVGAAGWWPRRINRPAGDPGCTYKDGTDTWGGHCCMKEYSTTSTTLSPFDEEMTLILKAINVKQLAVYQPSGTDSDFGRVTAWDQRTNLADNLWFTQKGDGSAQFLGDLTQNDCVSYVAQASLFDCGDGRDYYCPNDKGVLHRGFAGSKLVVFLGSMDFTDGNLTSCDGSGTGAPGPWVAFVASELIRDGGRKWNGACNCYSKTGTVGDGCGEINVFEVVMDNNDYSNREFMSTGVRSFQAGHVGGAVCQSSCKRSAFANDADVVDACAKKAYERGPVIATGGSTDGCPVWMRPQGDRYFFILLDQTTRVIQVGVVHPANIPPALAALLPELPGNISRAAVDAIVSLRLPQ